MPAFRPFLTCFALLLGLLSSCGHRYEGYKTGAYSIRGIRYIPMQPREAVGFREQGLASWYNEHRFLWFGGTTSLGEPFKARAMAAAHKTLPLPCRVRVRNLRNGRSVVVRVNDRGPFVAGRIIDVTPAAARKLGFEGQGLAPVEIEVLSVGDGSWRIR